MKALLMSALFVVIGSQAFAAGNVVLGNYTARDKETGEMVVDFTLAAGNKFTVEVKSPIQAACTEGTYTLTGTTLTATPTKCNNAVLTGKSLTLDVANATGMAPGTEREVNVVIAALGTDPVTFILKLK